MLRGHLVANPSLRPRLDCVAAGSSICNPAWPTCMPGRDGMVTPITPRAIGVLNGSSDILVASAAASRLVIIAQPAFVEDQARHGPSQLFPVSRGATERADADATRLKIPANPGDKRSRAVRGTRISAACLVARDYLEGHTTAASTCGTSRHVGVLMERIVIRHQRCSVGRVSTREAHPRGSRSPSGGPLSADLERADPTWTR